MNKQFILAGVAATTASILPTAILAEQLASPNIDSELQSITVNEQVETDKEAVKSIVPMESHQPIEPAFPIDEELQVEEQLANEESLVIKTVQKAEPTYTATIETETAETTPTFYTQFPDEALRNAVLQNFSGLNETSEITPSLIQNTLELEILGKNVKTLEGIHIFNNLFRLHIENTSIQYISSDVFALSKLSMLELEYNDKLQSISQSLWSLPLDSFHLVASPMLTQLPIIPTGARVLSTLSYLAIDGTHLTDISFITHKRFQRLRMFIFDYNHIVHLPTSDTFPIESNYKNFYIVFNGNQLVSVPEVYKTFYDSHPNGSLSIGSDLTHPDIANNFNGSGGFKSQLILVDGKDALTVRNGTLEAADTLRSFVDIKPGLAYQTIPLTLSEAHIFSLVDLINEDGVAVLLGDYYVNGMVIKEGTVRARIRSMPQGESIGELSPHAVTDYIDVSFELTAQPVTVHYVDEDGVEIAESISLQGEIGEAYTARPVQIEGYTLLRVEGVEEGQFSKDAQTVTYIYETNAVAPPPTEVDEEVGDNNTDNEQQSTVQPTTLPQTDASSTVRWASAGWALVGFASFLLLRRRKEK